LPCNFSPNVNLPSLRRRLIPLSTLKIALKTLTGAAF
jgi:hypothetical protein